MPKQSVFAPIYVYVYAVNTHTVGTFLLDATDKGQVYE